MKKIEMNKLGRVLKVILIVGFIILIPILIASPMLLNHTRRTAYSMVIIYPNGVLLLAIVYQFIKLFKSLEVGKPFTFKNTKILKRTGFISLILSVSWFIDLLFMTLVMKNTYINYVIVLVFLSLLFFGVAIALYILGELIRQATIYKEENDLTI